MCGFSSDGTCRRLFRLVGDLYDTSDLPCVLLVRCNSRAPARREGPVYAFLRDGWNGALDGARKAIGDIFAP